ncbi:MAG: L,D-transpeptidase [Chloroflexota bacterium]
MIRRLGIMLTALSVLWPLLSPLAAREADACAAIIDDRKSSGEVCGVVRDESVPYATWWVRAHSRAQTFSEGRESREATGDVEVGQFFRVEAQQDGPRLRVWDPRNDVQTWIPATAVGPVDPPAWADFSENGRWLDVSLTVPQNITAYQGDAPVMTALVTAGTGGTTTPGFYRILRRVANETMDSRRAPGVTDTYLLKNVLWTQYFTFDGAAIHYNWWGPPNGFGRPGSHGCLGMMHNDSKFLWDWATVGTPLVIHI